ncbi:MAG: zinc-binding dehydrogenase [Armatimonadetes bacterium]|nr:zinc-binding dehydrogenase [Armatimonadota bacterium]
MRQAVLLEPGRIEVREVPIPAPGPGEVLLRVRTALTCGTDLKTFRRGHPKLPFGPFGHECAGDAAGLGAGVTWVREGDAVVPLPTAPCGACPPCRAGRENLCERLFDEMVLGAYADYLLIRPRVAAVHLLPKPASRSYIESAFLEPLACVVHGWRRLPEEACGTLAVVGLGTIGLLFILMARRHGARVLAVGRRADRLRLAAALGADAVVDAESADAAAALASLTGGRGPTTVIECTGDPAVWEAGAAWAVKGGTVLLFSGLRGGTRVSYDAARLHYDEVTLTGAFHYRPDDAREAHRLLATGEIAVRPLVTAVRPLDEITGIFAALDRGQGIKYAVTPEDAAWI